MSKNLFYKLRLFGAGQLLRSDGEDCTPKLKKALGILAYLAVAHGRPIARAKLQDLFWEDSPQKQGRESLKACLSHLRQCFSAMEPNPIQTNGGPVSLCLDRVECDLFLQSTKQGLYRPVFLEGIDFNEEGAEDWLRFIRNSTETEQVIAPATRLDKRGTKEALLRISQYLENLARQFDTSGRTTHTGRFDASDFQLSLSSDGNAVEVRFSDLSRPI